MRSGLCLISASVYQRNRKQLQRKSKRTKKRWCHWGTTVGKLRMFHGCFCVGSASLKKFQTSWLAKCFLALLFRQPISFCRSTVYVHTSMHAVSVCFHNPLSQDTDDRIFTVPTSSFNACVYTHVLFALTYSVRLNGCLFQGGGGLNSSFYEILEATMHQI